MDSPLGLHSRYACSQSAATRVVLIVMWCKPQPVRSRRGLQAFAYKPWRLFAARIVPLPLRTHWLFPITLHTYGWMRFTSVRLIQTLVSIHKAAAAWTVALPLLLLRLLPIWWPGEVFKPCLLKPW